LKRVSLGVQPPGLTTDAYYLQIFSRPSVAATDDTPPPEDRIARVGDFGLVDIQLDKVLTLAIEVPTTGSPSTITAPALDPTRRQVTAWLARVQDDDRSVRWITNPGSPRCIAFAGGCFDMRTASTMLLTAIDAAVTRAVNPPPGGGVDPDPQIRIGAGKVSLVSFIPNIVTPASRGVGLIFAIDVEGRRFGDANVGSPYFPARIYLPVALLFRSDGVGLALTIDPFDLPPGAGLFGAPSVEVTNMLPGPPIDAALIAQDIQTRMKTTIAVGILMPAASPSDRRRLLAKLFDDAHGNVPPNPSFDVVLVPETSVAVHGRLVFPTLLPAADYPGVQLVFLE
jgi:hypothetical protein